MVYRSRSRLGYGKGSAGSRGVLNNSTFSPILYHFPPLFASFQNIFAPTGKTFRSRAGIVKKWNLQKGWPRWCGTHWPSPRPMGIYSANGHLLGREVVVSRARTEGGSAVYEKGRAGSHGLFNNSSFCLFLHNLFTIFTFFPKLMFLHLGKF